MALRWLVYSACNVLGYHQDTNVDGNVGCPNVQIKRSSKVGSQTTMENSKKPAEMYTSGFQMPLHYPRYTKADYEKMEEWRVDVLLREYGLTPEGTLEDKRAFAIGAFLWPDQYYTNVDVNGGCPNDQIKRSSKVGSETMMEDSKKPAVMDTSGFQMPLHYPRYTKADYEKMEEWRVDLLLREYGLTPEGTLEEKRAFAMGAFLWPDQY